MKNKNEKGSIMVEATIYYPVIILVIGVIIVISMMKLQQCLITATLVNSTDAASIDAMDKENVANKLDKIDAVLSSFSIIKGKNRIVEVENKGNLINTVNVKLEYTFEAPAFCRILLKGTRFENQKTRRSPVAEITALTINPRDMVDTMDQHILFGCTGPSYGNLMMGKYSASLSAYLYKQYYGK